MRPSTAVLPSVVWHRLKEPVMRYRPARRPLAVLVRDPLVVYLRSFCPGGFEQYEPLFQRLAGEAATFLVAWWWWAGTETSTAYVRRYMRDHRRRHPGHRFVSLCNTEEERQLFVRHGIEAVHCSHNAFVDERIYRPLEVVADHDAVYDARLRTYKRHHLCADVESLLVLYSFSPELDRWQSVRRGERSILHATFPNHRWHGYASLPAARVASTLARARVGLCLSEEEGAMYASVQYLLCGLPVVTTPSRGGRDVFFDADNALCVPSDARSIARGVRELIDRDLDPGAIRRRALDRMLVHRAAFLRLLDGILAGAGSPLSARDVLAGVFSDKLLRSCRLDSV